MVTASVIRGLARRLEKAEFLVADGAVDPIDGCDGYFAVKNGDGAQVYLVNTTDGREKCSCPDFTEWQGPVGLTCKHQLAVEVEPKVTDENPRPDRRLGMLLLSWLITYDSGP